MGWFILGVIAGSDPAPAHPNPYAMNDLTLVLLAAVFGLFFAVIGIDWLVARAISARRSRPPARRSWTCPDCRRSLHCGGERRMCECPCTADRRASDVGTGADSHG